MEIREAVTALTALGQSTRLAIFRLLVEAGPEGMMAGDIANGLAVPAATLSFHLKDLSHAGLIEGEARGRFVCYRANFIAMNRLIEFMTRNCCAGSKSKLCRLSTTTAKRSATARRSKANATYSSRS